MCLALFSMLVNIYFKFVIIYLIIKLFTVYNENLQFKDIIKLVSRQTQQVLAQKQNVK